MSDEVLTIDQMREVSLIGGGKSRIDRQHQKGKLTARERINALVDPGAFSEIGQFSSSEESVSKNGKDLSVGVGVITGQAEIHGRPVYLFAQDFTVMGGSVGKTHGKKIARIMQMAIQNGTPLIGLNDSGGARIQEGVKSLAAYGDIFYNNVQVSRSTAPYTREWKSELNTILCFQN